MFQGARPFLSPIVDGGGGGLGDLRPVISSLHDRVTPGQDDAIFAASGRCNRDSRPKVMRSGVAVGAGKVDLVLGANVGNSGAPRGYEMASLAEATDRVHAAWRKGFETRDCNGPSATGYIPPKGADKTCGRVEDLLLGESLAQELRSGGRVATIQTVGGTGAIYAAFQYLCGRTTTTPTPLFAGPICASEPAWPNYRGMANLLQVPFEAYPYLSADNQSVDVNALVSYIDGARAGSVVSLQLVGHNPTGVDIPKGSWPQIIEVFRARHGEVVLLLDAAYMGLGAGFAADRSPIEQACHAGIDFFVAMSFSKALEIYGHRLGYLLSVRPSSVDDVAREIGKTRGRLGDQVARPTWSNPPRQGSDLLEAILGDAQLSATFCDEVSEMAQNYRTRRELFVAGMKARGFGDRFDFVAKGVGMFSLLDGIDETMNNRLAALGVHMFKNRLVVAGLTPHNIDYVCDALAQVLREQDT